MRMGKRSETDELYWTSNEEQDSDRKSCQDLDWAVKRRGGEEYNLILRFHQINRQSWPIPLDYGDVVYCWCNVRLSLESKDEICKGPPISTVSY